ncbi:MAG: hypothetical protein WC458_00245 [Patescibacteria group bacterium]
MNRLINKKNIFIGAVIIFFLTIITIFSNNFLILGGEGNYFLDVSLVKNLYGHTWLPLTGGLGAPNSLVNFPVGIFDFFDFLYNIGMSVKTVNTISVFLIYFLPFIAMFFLLDKCLKIELKTSILISLFYIFNPFSAIHLYGQTFWNLALLFVLPITFSILYKYFLNYKKLFIYFGIFTALVSFSFAGIPYFAIFHIFLLMSLIIISYLQENKLKAKRILMNFVILELSFVLFNFWWLLPFFKFAFFDAHIFYTRDIAINWINSSSGFGSMMSQLLSLRFLGSFIFPSYYYNSSIVQFYDNNFVKIILYIPLLIIAGSLFIKNQKWQKAKIVVLVTFLIVLFLTKGANNPFANIYMFLMNYAPLFYIFKSPWEKFGVLLAFIFTLTLVFAMIQKKGRFNFYLLGGYLVVCSIPFLTLNFIPDFSLNKVDFVTRKFIDKTEYQQVRQVINNDKLDYRLLSLPGSLNYQITMLNHGSNKYYRGMDPIMLALNKSFVATYWGSKFDIIYNNFSNENVENSLSIFNIRKILINADIVPSFGFKEKENITELNELFSLKMSKWESGSIKLFKNDYFLPTFYTTKSIIISSGSINRLSDIVFNPCYQIRSAVYFQEQNQNNQMGLDKLGALISSNNINIGEENDVCRKIKIEIGDLETRITSSDLEKDNLLAKKQKKELVDNNIRLNELKFDLNKKINYYDKISREQESESPVLEFRKINPIKYRVVVHHARKSFPLIFGESFHDGWKVYLGNRNVGNKVDEIKLVDYKVLDGNSDDQASRDEVDYFITQGLITDLGNGVERVIKHKKFEDNKENLDYLEKYKIDFISKNIQGTIQNNNLSTGHFYETWFKQPVADNTDHLLANSYANSWLIDTDKICTPTNNCHKNADGSYDMELIIEFWPQRLFYIGLFITSLTLFNCLGYLIYSWRRKNKKY